jgi:vesicle-associated membrane protein 7
MIVYAVVCRSSDAAILSEYSTDDLTGNAPQCTAAILEHLRDHPNILKEGDLKTFRNTNKSSSRVEEEDFLSQFLQACTVAITTAEEMDLGSVEEHFFHLWHREGIFYCCLGDDKEARQQKVNFGFLQALSQDFGKRYSKRRIKNANSYALDKDFKPVLRSTMHHYNVHRKDILRQENGQIDHLLTQVEDLKGVLGRNLNLLLERDQHIDSLMHKASQARQDSMIFKKSSVKVKRHVAMKAYKMWFLICFSVFTFLYLIIISACGFNFSYCRSQG